ncbi:hypothetical protein [Nonomuraea rhodomycinica]|uniref:Uncharacterized protein n=1 Tax=Nonomuraea rhodomycinica TaxID=1712872 RepID=A0A7Y6IPW4_9ACTN|nr:hypothetical protein [Nonomuraea rhodomycinica]NUW41875.1 hypothetical protein [Nonomuraea rhodomycinica]
MAMPAPPACSPSAPPRALHLRKLPDSPRLGPPRTRAPAATPSAPPAAPGKANGRPASGKTAIASTLPPDAAELALVSRTDYHLYALPGAGNRLRVAADWTLGALLGRNTASLGLVPDAAAGLVRAEQLGIHPPAGARTTAP